MTAAANANRTSDKTKGWATCNPIFVPVEAEAQRRTKTGPRSQFETIGMLAVDFSKFCRRMEQIRMQTYLKKRIVPVIFLEIYRVFGARFFARSTTTDGISSARISRRGVKIGFAPKKRKIVHDNFC